ncbi:MAG: 23S rRNA (uracil(1939)-C(5))-methyltransferase RlmD [Candidatus Melainabacteria bacterium]|nr:23S rRNA (uracil(1939)-C(5))-methyltransferase RlmD [Candidatus Melainabacteria bacterium]
MAKSTLQSIPVSEGQSIELKIDSMAYDNSAIGRYKDFVVMVDRGSPGDYVKASVTMLRPNYARAKITEIEKFDPAYRIDPPCKIFKVCGGCQWQHLSYEKQLEQKDLLLKKFFSKLNLEDGVLKNIIGSDNPWNYRNKVQYPVRTVADTGRLKAGYFEWHSNDLVNIKFCPIQHNVFDQIVETVRELSPKYNILAYDGKKKTGWLRHICVRIGINTNEALLTLVAVNESLSKSQEFAKEVMDKHPELVGVCININTKTTNVIYGDKTKVIKGRSYIFEKINDLKFKISATSFFQVNTAQAVKLLNILENYAGLTGQETILDAYCGVGLISIFLAKNAKKVLGIEEIKQSIDDAVFSMKENNIKNIAFVNGKVENKIEEALSEEKADVVVLDPPRIGCNKKVLEAIAEKNLKKIIYVSCNPTTLARDLEILNLKNYKIKSIQPVDMFPHSYHVECVVLLEN